MSTKALLNLLFFVFYLLPSVVRGDFIMDVKKHLKCETLNTNGLKICVYEMDSPKTSVQIWYRVGAGDENNEYAGIAHVFEHMMFKGTKKRGVGEIAKEIESVGGNMNAYTSYDFTAYVINIPSEYVEKAIDIISDISMNSTFPESELKKEIEVIVEEYKRGEDSPGAKLWKETLNFAFEGSPYGIPVIGYPETIRKIKTKDLYLVMDKWYRPENAMLVVAGGVKSEEVFRIVRKYFANWKSSGIKEKRVRQERKRSGGPFIKIFKKKDLQEPRFALVFPGTSRLDEKAPLYSLLAGSLGGTLSSRLVRNLRLKKDVLPAISASSWEPLGKGAVFVEGTLLKKNYKQALQDVFSELSMFAFLGPTDDEFNDTRQSLLNEIKTSFERSSQVSEILGSLFSEGGDADDFFKYVERLKQAKIKDVKELSSKVINLDHASFVFMIPEDMDIKEEEIKEIMEKYFQSEDRYDLKMKKGKYGIEKLVLPNGLECLLLPRKNTNTVSITLAFSGGISAEDSGKNGVAHLTASSLKRGSKYHSAQELASLEERYFNYLYARADTEFFSVNAGFLKEDLLNAINLFSEMVLYPKFDKEEIEKVKKDQISYIRKKLESPESRLIKKLKKLAFPSHPYGREVLGEEKTVEKLTPDDVKEYYSRIATSKNGVLTVVGDFDIKLMENLLAQYFSELPEGKQKIVIVAPEKVERIQKDFEQMETKQAHIALSFYTPGSLNASYYPVEIIENALSGMSGRLFMRLREKLALAYSVTAIFTARTRAGLFVFYIATSPESVKTAVEGFKKEIEKLIKNSLTEEEIERAKNFITGNYKMGFETNQAYSERIAYNEMLYGNYLRAFQFTDKIKSVSPGEVKRAIIDIMDKTIYQLVVVGPEKAKKSAGDELR